MKILDFDIALDKSTKRFTIEKNKKAYYFQFFFKQLFNCSSPVISVLLSLDAG